MTADISSVLRHVYSLVDFLAAVFSILKKFMLAECLGPQEIKLISLYSAHRDDFIWPLPDRMASFMSQLVDKGQVLICVGLRVC